MAILKDLIVHGSSRFLNKIYASEIQTPLIKAEAGIIKKLKADDATIVGLLDVQGQLHTSSWTNSNIATIDGSFYITPTIESSQGTVGNISTSTLNFSRKSGGDDFATVSSLYLGNGTSITWPRYSKILITGQILLNGEWIPLGTLLGQLNAAATAASIKVYNITDNKNRNSSILTTLANSGITSTTYRNLKISLYQRANGASSFYPLGIYMTATGINGRTFLDIYGGVELLNSNINNSDNYGGFADPNVRIGNLQGLPSVGGQTPKGWGIYTDNGYFKGIIAADRGYIGSGSKYWVIANEEDVISRSYIYNGTNSITSTTEGVYLGTDGIRNYKDDTHNVTIKDGVISALGVDLSGKITASSGSIAGWTIKSTYLINSETATAPADNLLLLSPNGTSTKYTIAGQLLSGWTFTSGTTFGINKDGGVYATLGKIGGWNLNSDGFYITNSIPGYNANTLVFSKGTASTNAIGGSDTTSKNWMISAGTGFGVTATGALYANDAHISGEITATSGTIGGIQIVNGNLNVSSIRIGDLKGGKGLSSNNLLQDIYASSLAKENAPWDRYLSDASNTTITGAFLTEANLPDPNATHFYRITDSSASTKGRGLCFYVSGTPPFIDGHTYRIGCWVRKHSGSPKVQITLGSYGSWMPTQRKIENTEWEWIEVVRTFGDTDSNVTTQSDTYKRLYFYFYNNNVAGSSLDMCGFKMEELQTNSGTARNLLLGTEKLTNWGVVNGATISDGVASFPSITANSWREIYPAKNFKYELIRNQYAIFSIKVKGNVDEKCCVNLCIGVDTTETAYARKKYFSQFIYFVGTGEWQTVCSALPIFDYMFNTGSETIDFDNCWVTVRIGAVSTYHNGFQAKEPQLCLGTTATSWSRAPEDVDETIDNIEIGGRNLLKKSDILDLSKTNKGITRTYLGDGWFEVSGTVTGTNAGILPFYGTGYHTSNIVGSGIYTLSIETTGTVLVSDLIYVQTAFHSDTATDDTIAGGFNIFSSNSKVTFTVPENNHISRVCLLFKANATDQQLNGTIRFKLEKGNKATDWTPAPEDTQESINSVSTTANTALSQSVWYAECPTAAGTAVKIATISPVVTNFILTKGVTVNVKFTNTNSATNSSLQLNVNGTGAKNIKYIYNGTYTNIVAGYLKANQMYQFRYDGTYWIVQMMYNTNNYDRSQYAVSLYASEAISSTKIAVLGLDGKLHILNSSSFSISCPLLYVGTTYSADDVTKPTARASNYTYWGASFNLSNTHSIQNAIANTNVYVVGTLSGDIFTPSTTVLTCAEPTTEDGLYYMLLGRMTSTTNAVLQAEHPIYVYTNGKFQKLEGTTATNFIQANSSGIFIHPAGTNADFTNNEAVGVQINSNSIDIYKPQTGVGSHLPIASYGQTTRIGLNNTSHFLIESGKISAYSNNSDIYFETSGGSGQVQQKYVVPELPVTLTLSHEIETIISVEIDSVLTTNYSFEKGSTSVVLNDRPITATTITITYTYTVAAVNDAGQEEISVQEVKNLDAVSTALSFNLQYNGTTIQSVSHTPYTLSSNNDIINITNRPSSGTMITIVFTLSNPNPYFTFNNRGIGLKGSGSVSFANGGIATGDSSFVIGTRNTASGKNSFSAGEQNVASAKSSFTLGEHLTANGIGSLITGRYNVANSSSLFTVGNGILNNSSNAFSVLESGDCIIAGRLLQGNGSSSRPIFRVETEVYKAIGIGPGLGYSASRKIEKEGYVGIAILGFEAINNSSWTNSYADAGWCVIPRVWLGHSTTIDTPNQVVNSVTFYIWNQNSQKMVNVDFCVKILYISTSVL